MLVWYTLKRVDALMHCLCTHNLKRSHSLDVDCYRDSMACPAHDARLRGRFQASAPCSHRAAAMHAGLQDRAA
jgi:hypothetical protein